MDNGEEDRARELLTRLGLATLNAQALEYSLVSLVAAYAHAGGLQRGPELRQLMDTCYSKTFGQLVTFTLSRVPVSEAIGEELRRAVQARNWVSHNFYREHGPASSDPELCWAALKALHRAADLFIELKELIDPLTVGHLKTTGLTETEIEERAVAATKAYAEAGSPEEQWSGRLRKRW